MTTPVSKDLVQDAFEELLAEKCLGIGQEWQQAETTDTGATFFDGSPSYRTTDETYTNTSGRPIKVRVNSNFTTGTASVIFTINGNQLPNGTYQRASGSGGVVHDSEVIPAGATYSVSIAGGNIR